VNGPAVSLQAAVLPSNYTGIRLVLSSLYAALDSVRKWLDK